MSVEAYIPYDLRERLAEQIKVIDKMMTDAVAAERERCADEIYRLQIENDRLKETDAYKAVAAERKRCDAEMKQWEMRAKTAEGEVMRRPTVTELKNAVTAERERCERVIGGLMYESYDISGPECLSRALAAIRKGE